ncbi:MAG: response regulator [Bacteroidales bacterium]|nr:response regulator [Bacteroidales bacterium]
MNDNQYTLLIVDDNLDNVELLEEILGSQGYRTLRAQTGHDAVRLAANEQPDLILLDIAMPVMDGLDVLHVLKSSTTTAAIPIVFVTGIMENENILRSIENHDVIGYIAKPIVISELLEKIPEYLSGVEKKL